MTLKRNQEPVKYTNHYIITVLYCISISYSAEGRINKYLSFQEAVIEQSLHSPRSTSAFLQYKNSVLSYGVYRRSFFPIIQMNVSPLGFNRSLRLLQDPYTGAYHSVENNANTSDATLNIIQKVGPLGGSLTVGMGLSVLYEFSNKRASYSSIPFFVSYNQPLRGGFRSYRYEQTIAHLKRDMAISELCTSLATEQAEVADLYMLACIEMIKMEIAEENIEKGDTLLKYASLKREHGDITNYDYDKIYLEQLEKKQEFLQAKTAFEEKRHRLFMRLKMNDEGDALTIPDLSLVPKWLDEDEVRREVYENNPKEREIELKKQQALLDLHTKRLSTQFNGQISIDYGLNQYATSLHEAYKKPNQRQAVSMTMEIPVFDWGVRRKKRHIAENEYRQTELILDEVQREADSDIHVYTVNYNNARNKFEIYRDFFDLSREQYREAILRFEQGYISVYELIASSHNLQQALIQHLSSLQMLFKTYFQIRLLALYDFISKQKLEHIFLQEIQ